MSQLDGGAIQQVKDLVISGYHLRDIEGLACPTAILPEGVGVESLERFGLERFASAALWKQPALPILFATPLAMPKRKSQHAASLTPTT